MNICNFCEKTFSTKTNLVQHQKTAKYCLVKQNISSNKFNCDECLKYFSNKSSMIRHKQSCEYNILKPYKDKMKILENENNIYKKQIEYQQNIIKELKNITLKAIEKPININNNNQKISNTINNKYVNISPFIIKEGEIERKVKNNFTEKMFLDGQQGVADFTYNNILLDDNGDSKYICNDISRGNFVYKDDKGEIKTDYKADKLINMIYKPVVAKSELIKNDIISKNNNLETKAKCLDIIIEIKDINDTFTNNKFRNMIGILNKRNENLPLVEDNVLNSIIPINYNYMLSQSKFLTEEHIRKGIKGYVELAVNYSFKDRVCFLDKNILTYKKEVKNEIIIEDNNGIEICIDFFKSIEKQNKKLSNILIGKLQSKMIIMEDNINIDEEEYDSLQKLLEEIEDNNNSITNITRTKEDIFLSDFINILQHAFHIDLF